MALLAAALRAQTEGVFVAQARSGARGVRILFANASFCTITGYPAAELVGRSHGLFHSRARDVQRVQSWLRRGPAQQPLTGEGLLVRADGTTVPVLWTFAPINDARGRLTHVVATYRDQTGRRRLQEALVHSQRLDAVGRLAGGVAHDFNNLLSVINGYCEILTAHVASNSQALREVAEIHNAGLKAASLTQQLLAFSRRQPFNARIINLNDLACANVEILQRLLGDAVQLELALQEELGNVRTDPAQFQQVLFNLVMNARDAVGEGGRIVVTTAHREIKPGLNRRAVDSPPGRYVTLTVADNGTGMDAETQKHLFEPFFTTKPEGKGTGLGLALVYGVVQQSAGIITVNSTLQVGSSFEVSLPLVNEPVDDVPVSVAALPSTRGSEVIVLIEQDDLVRKMVSGMLTADGYRVSAVKSFAEVTREKLAAGPPVQLLIANLAGEGEKTVRRVRASHPEVRVVWTSHPGAKESVRWLPVAQQMSLTKPYALSELLRRVRQLLDA